MGLVRRMTIKSFPSLNNDDVGAVQQIFGPELRMSSSDDFVTTDRALGFGHI